MNPAQVNASPIVGQYRALLEPLSLIQVASCEMVFPSYPTINCRAWRPHTVEEVVYLGIIPANRLLWFKTSFCMTTDVELYRPGAVFLSEAKDRLFFISPGTQPEPYDPRFFKVEVLADWAVKVDDFHRSILFQPGPPENLEAAETGALRYERREPV